MKKGKGVADLLFFSLLLAAFLSSTVLEVRYRLILLGVLLLLLLMLEGFIRSLRRILQLLMLAISIMLLKTVALLPTPNAVFRENGSFRSLLNGAPAMLNIANSLLFSFASFSILKTRLMRLGAVGRFSSIA